MAPKSRCIYLEDTWAAAGKASPRSSSTRIWHQSQQQQSESRRFSFQNVGCALTQPDVMLLIIAVTALLGSTQESDKSTWNVTLPVYIGYL